MTLEVAFCVSCPSLHSRPYPTPSSPSGLNPSIPVSLPLHNYSIFLSLGDPPPPYFLPLAIISVLVQTVAWLLKA